MPATPSQVLAPFFPEQADDLGEIDTLKWDDRHYDVLWVLNYEENVQTKARLFLMNTSTDYPQAPVVLCLFLKQLEMLENGDLDSFFFKMQVIFSGEEWNYFKWQRKQRALCLPAVRAVSDKFPFNNLSNKKRCFDFLKTCFQKYEIDTVASEILKELIAADSYKHHHKTATQQ